MRITAGRLRGRKITVPDIPGVRPTPSKVRQAMFNILGNIEGFAILELFSGSGLMAVESLSRGAASVVSVERDKRIVARLKAVRDQLDLHSEWRIVTGDVSRQLAGMQGQGFDLVFADPPYDAGVSEKIPQWLDDAGIACGQLIVEEAASCEPVWPAGWTEQQARRYGGTCLHFLGKEGA